MEAIWAALVGIPDWLYFSVWLSLVAAFIMTEVFLRRRHQMKLASMMQQAPEQKADLKLVDGSFHGKIELTNNQDRVPKATP